MKLVDKVYSKVDNVVKYVFLRWDSHIVEFSYIDSNTNKDIICVSVKNMCNLGCKFCHTTDYIGKIPCYSLTEWDISGAITTIVKENKKYDTLLISYMGVGEPLDMAFEGTLISSIRNIKQYVEYNNLYKNIRFAVATCLPKNRVSRFFKFCMDVKEYDLPIKLHLSLHYTDDKIRNEWMPASLNIKSSLAACKFYKEYTGNNVEIHYTLIEGLNDTDEDIEKLNSFLINTGFNLKFITYNEKDTLEYKTSSRVDDFRNKIKVPYEYFTANGSDISSACGMYLLDAFKEMINISTEFYTPPGKTVGSSCGSFLFETHKKYLGDI